jgi:sugar lactone lactonase YvrE
MGLKFEIAVDAHAFIGEGPVWDGDRGVLWWIDSFRNEIHSYAPTTGEDRTVDVGAQIGAVALRASGGLVAAMPEGLVAVDPDTGKQEVLATVDHDSTTMRLNDGKCDSRGRFWAGSVAHNPTDPVAVAPVPGMAKLYRFDPDGTVHAMLDGVTFSNGMGWSPGGDTFYYVDTMTHAVDAFDFDADAGSISNRRTLVSVLPTEGNPDGMCVDEDGCVWLTLSGAGQLRRITPTGELDRTLRVPISRVTSCAFGGPGLEDLYVTSHSALMSKIDTDAEPGSGALLRCTPGVRGLPTTSFAG